MSTASGLHKRPFGAAVAVQQVVSRTRSEDVSVNIKSVIYHRQTSRSIELRAIQTPPWYCNSKHRIWQLELIHSDCRRLSHVPPARAIEASPPNRTCIGIPIPAH